MTTPAQTSSSSTGTIGSTRPDSSNFNEWTELIPKEVTPADSLSVAESEKNWQEMYKLAGLATGSEKQKKAFRAWAYVQGCLNGTSRQGDFRGVDKLFDGTPVEAAIIPRVLGRDIRKHYRANMDESYKFFKTTRVMETYSRFIKKCAGLGIGASEAFATADWLDDCPHFTPGEAAAHAKSFNTSLARARRARDGKTLEQVEDEDLAQAIRVNGPDTNEIGRVERIDF